MFQTKSYLETRQKMNRRLFRKKHKRTEKKMTQSMS